MTRRSGPAPRPTITPFVCAAFLTGALAMPATAETVTVITSFPKELTAAYKKGFEAKYPNDKL